MSDIGPEDETRGQSIVERAKEDALIHETRVAQGDGIPFSSPDENDADQYLNEAKRLVVIDRQTSGDVTITTADVYITWFSKTLQNWKAVLSTNRPDGHYYELTHNGDKNETYFDDYIKTANTVYGIDEKPQDVTVAAPYDR